MEEISKNLKILILLNKLGSSGTANLLSHYRKKYGNDGMDGKNVADVLNYHYKRALVRKKYGKRNPKFWGSIAQVYEVTNRGKEYLKMKEVTYNRPLIIP